MAEVESSQKVMECVFLDIFSRSICSTVAETIGVTTTQQVLARENVQKTTFEAAEMMLGPWNQQIGIEEGTGIIKTVGIDEITF